jgi:hypothetical protein
LKCLLDGYQLRTDVRQWFTMLVGKHSNLFMFATSDEKLDDVGKKSIPLLEDQTAGQDDTKLYCIFTTN